MKNLFFKLFSVFCLMFCICNISYAEEIYSIEGIGSNNSQTSAPSSDNNYNLKTYTRNNINYVNLN